MKPSTTEIGHLRFQRPNAHLLTTFGNDWFALKAEAFARFSGTPFFLGAQTLAVLIGTGLNTLAITRLTKQLTERVETLALALHQKLLGKD